MPAPAAPTVLPPAPLAAPPAPPAAPALPVLAMDVLEELRTMMGEEYLGLIKLFLEDAPTHIQQLEAAAAANDLPGLVSPAHTLKSSSANLGALALSAVAKRIELGARTASLQRPTVAVLMLETEFRKAQIALQALMKPPA
jgi:HPt (histidine-containing phosphotransfer) domain-containing protein